MKSIFYVIAAYLVLTSLFSAIFSVQQTKQNSFHYETFVKLCDNNYVDLADDARRKCDQIHSNRQIVQEEDGF